MKQKERVIVSAILVSKDIKVLLGKVREGGVYPDCWHIPGGGVELDETKESALTREIQEETGIDIKGDSIKLLSDSDTGEAVKTDKKTGEKYLVKMHFNVYLVDLPENADEIRVSLDDDLREYRWVARSELKKYKHTPPSEKLFRKLGWLSNLDSLISQAKTDNVSRLSVAGIVLNHEGKLLLCQRSKKKKIAPGDWHIPGGGVDEGETIEQAIEREFSEELGLIVHGVHSSSGIVHDYPDESGTQRTVFILLQAQGQIQLNPENDAYAFVLMEELPEYLPAHVLDFNRAVMQYALERNILSDVE